MRNADAGRRTRFRRPKVFGIWAAVAVVAIGILFLVAGVPNLSGSPRTAVTLEVPPTTVPPSTTTFPAVVGTVPTPVIPYPKSVLSPMPAHAGPYAAHVASIPSEPCATDQLQAYLTGNGYVTTSITQYVVTVLSSSPCWMEGYPTISFPDDLRVTASNGIQLMNQAAQSVSKVAVLPTEAASFLISFGIASGNAAICKQTYVMDMGLAGQATQVTVSVAPFAQEKVLAYYMLCGSSVSVSPFNQGNSSQLYTTSTWSR